MLNMHDFSHLPQVHLADTDVKHASQTCQLREQLLCRVEHGQQRLLRNQKVNDNLRQVLLH